MEKVIENKIFEQILEIRNSGKYNMFELNSILREASNRGFYELVNLITENHAAYCNFILRSER